MSGNIIQLNEDLIKNDLKDLIRSNMEETLNALLDKEAGKLISAQKYGHCPERQGYHSGHYKQLYSEMFNAITDAEKLVSQAVGLMRTAQHECKETYLDADETPLCLTDKPEK